MPYKAYKAFTSLFVERLRKAYRAFISLYRKAKAKAGWKPMLEILYLFSAAITLRQWPSSAPALDQLTDQNEGGGGGLGPPAAPSYRRKQK